MAIMEPWNAHQKIRILLTDPMGQLHFSKSFYV